MRTLGITTGTVLMAITLSAADLPRVIAHRGGALEQDENTLAAIVNSYENGIRCLEVDVQITKDNRFLVLHDSTLDRTTDGTGRARDMTSEEIASVRTKKSGQPLSFLEDVLDFLNDKPDASIQIEIKMDKHSDGSRDEICRTVTDMVSTRMDPSRAVLISFDQSILQKIKETDPSLHICLASHKADIGIIKTAQQMGAEFVTVNLENLSVNFVKKAHEAGIQVAAWTITTPEQAQLAALMGVDFSVSDVPAALLEQKRVRP